MTVEMMHVRQEDYPVVADIYDFSLVADSKGYTAQYSLLHVNIERRALLSCPWITRDLKERNEWLYPSVAIS